jgi:hypothetical protein
MGLLLNGGQVLAASPPRDTQTSWVQIEDADLLETCLWEANGLPSTSVSRYTLPPIAHGTKFQRTATTLTIILPESLQVRNGHLLLELGSAIRRRGADFRLFEADRAAVQLNNEEAAILSFLFTNIVIPLP